MGAIEVLKVGRVGVDLYAEQKGASLVEARTFAKSVGGSPTNVGGALCRGLLAGATPVEAVRAANAAGAIVASRLLCADAMPTADEVDVLLDAAARA